MARLGANPGVKELLLLRLSLIGLAMGKSGMGKLFRMLY